MISFRKAVYGDSAMLLRWRNDPLTRKNSLQEDIVSLQEHKAWLRESLKSPKRTILIAEMYNSPIGTLRFDKRKTGLEMSWTVAPECRGKGLGTEMLQAAQKYFSGENIFARIKKDNIPSQIIALKTGFVFKKVKGNILFYERL